MPVRYNDSDYAGAAGTIWAIEKRLLNAAALERALDAPTAADTLRLLTQISEYDFGAPQRTADYEDVLKHELRRVFGLLYKLSPGPDVVDLPGLKYDYHNVKAALKAQYAAADTAGLLYDVTRTQPRAVIDAVRSGDNKELPEYLAEAVARGKAAFGKTGAPGDIDLALDRLMFAETRRRAERLGCDFILEYVLKTIDFYNLKTLFRVRAMAGGDAGLLRSALAGGGAIPARFFEDAYPRSADAIMSGFSYQFFGAVAQRALEDHDRTGSYASMEKLADDSLMEHLKKTRTLAFGPETLFAYLCAKETEIKQVRVIITGKINKIPSEAIKRRLRVCYV